MSKPYFEVASDIVQAVVKARGEAIASSTDAGIYVEKYLSDAAISNTYKAVLEALNKRV